MGNVIRGTTDRSVRDRRNYVANKKWICQHKRELYLSNPDVLKAYNRAYYREKLASDPTYYRRNRQRYLDGHYKKKGTYHRLPGLEDTPLEGNTTEAQISACVRVRLGRGPDLEILYVRERTGRRRWNSYFHRFVPQFRARATGIAVINVR